MEGEIKRSDVRAEYCKVIYSNELYEYWHFYNGFSTEWTDPKV